MSGLLVVGEVSAAATPSSFNVDCSGSSGNTVTTATGNIGDTFTITNTASSGTCYVVDVGSPTSLNVVSGSTTIPAGTTETYSILINGTTFQVSSQQSGTQTASNGIRLSFTAAAAVPTLSEWAQMMLALMVIGVAWHFHNNRQNSY
jgi:hypothetical protein